MSSKKDNSTNLKKYKSRRELNLGIFLFAIVFIYLIVTVIMYFTGDSISAYEVRRGSIVRDNSYTGLIIREETAVSAEAGGYVSYYQNENTKVKAGANIYALSQEKLDTTSTAADSAAGQSLNTEVQSGITYQIQSFNENYNANDFSSVYSLKNEISTSLQDAFSTTRMDQLDAAIAASGLDVTSYPAPRDGIVAFTVDGYESLTVDTFTADNFDRSAYEITALADQMKIAAGAPVYRLITSENWHVLVQMDRETAEELRHDGITSIKVRIDKDSETLWADFSIIEKEGDFYGCLSFDNSMIRYAEDRYLNIELILEDETGLKIPRSAVVEKKFYVIPQEYLTSGGSSSSDSVLVQQADGNAELHDVTIYDASEEGEVCINMDTLSEGDVLIKPESSETYTIGKIKTLTGVYNINKGYAVFKKVSILCENDEYYIVQEGEAYGLYNYDHIVQNGAGVSQDDVVFQ